jgi:hypothetical protein
MEPQDNKKIALGKAINAHELAEAALNDLAKDGADPRYQAMLDRVRQNVEELRAESAISSPAERV